MTSRKWDSGHIDNTSHSFMKLSSLRIVRLYRNRMLKSALKAAGAIKAFRQQQRLCSRVRMLYIQTQQQQLSSHK